MGSQKGLQNNGVPHLYWRTGNRVESKLTITRKKLVSFVKLSQRWFLRNYTKPEKIQATVSYTTLKWIIICRSSNDSVAKWVFLWKKAGFNDEFPLGSYLQKLLKLVRSAEIRDQRQISLLILSEFSLI